MSLISDITMKKKKKKEEKLEYIEFQCGKNGVEGAC